MIMLTRSFAGKPRSISSILGVHASTSRTAVRSSLTPGCSASGLPLLDKAKDCKTVNQSVIVQQNPVTIDKDFTDKINRLLPNKNILATFVYENGYTAKCKDIKMASISEETTNNLFNTIGKVLFRPLQDMTLSDQYSDESFSIPNEGWKELRAVHILLQQLLISGFPRFVTKWLLSGGLEKIFGLLLSPDPKEVSTVETTVLLIYRAFPTTHDNLFCLSQKNLMRFIAGFHSFHGVATILKFLDMHFQVKKGQWNVNENRFFQQILLPLLLNPFVNEYYIPLNRVLTQAYQKQPQFAAMTINKMLKCWPVTNTSKLVCYIHHISVLGTNAGPQVLSQHIPKMFQKLVLAAQSDNHKVCIAALRICSDMTFIFEYITPAGPYIRELLESAQKACNHWSDEAKEIAKQAVTTIMNAAPQIRLLSPPPQSFQRPSQTWQNLSRSTGIKLVGKL